MKKSLIILLICFIAFPLFTGMSVHAEMREISEELGIDTESLGDSLSPEVREIVEERGFSPENTDAMTAVTPAEVMKFIWDKFKEAMVRPLKVLASLIAVIAAAAVVESMEDSISSKPLSGIFGAVCVLVSVGVISGAVSECISSAAEALDSGGMFMLGYVPVFAGITASSGSVTSAVVYNMLVVLVAEISVQFSGEIIVPALSVCMAMGIVEALNPDFHLSGITEAVKNAVTFVLGFIMTVFLGLLSLQSILGASADTLGVKAAKFVVSNFVPVIGGAVADTYTTVKNSLGLLRGGVGFFGIAVIFIMILPPILEAAAMKLIFMAAGVVSELFGVPRLKVLMKNTNWILSAVFSILVSFSVMLIISTAILMLVGLAI